MIEVVEAVTDLYGTCIHMLWRVPGCRIPVTSRHALTRCSRVHGALTSRRTQADHGAQMAIGRRSCNGWAVALLPAPASKVRPGTVRQQSSSRSLLRRLRSKPRPHGAINSFAVRSPGCHLKLSFASAAASLAEDNLLLRRKHLAWRAYFSLSRQTARRRSSSLRREGNQMNQRLHALVLHSRRVPVEGHFLEQSLRQRFALLSERLVQRRARYE